MSTKLFVGNLPSTQPKPASGYVRRSRTVQEVDLIMDKFSGRPRGFAFVTMETKKAPMRNQALNGKSIDGRALTVNEALRVRTSSHRRSGGGGYDRGAARRWPRRRSRWPARIQP